MLSGAERNIPSRLQAKIDAGKLRGQIVELSAEEEKFLDANRGQQNRMAIHSKVKKFVPANGFRNARRAHDHDHDHDDDDDDQEDSDKR